MRDAHVLWSGLEYVADLSHYTTNEHGLSRVQHLLRATTTSSTARLASRARDLHRALRGQGLTPGTPEASKNRKLGSECVYRRIVPAFGSISA